MKDNGETKFLRILFDLLKQNKDAFSLCLDLVYCGHFWDDMIDKDKERSDDELNYAFEAMLARIPRNPFFQDNIRDIAPLLMSTVLQWKDANKLEAKGTHNERSMAFMLRNMLMQVVAYCIWIVGGDEWYATSGEQFQRLCAEELDSLYGTFMKEMEDA